MKVNEKVRKRNTKRGRMKNEEKHGFEKTEKKRIKNTKRRISKRER